MLSTCLIGPFCANGPMDKCMYKLTVQENEPSQMCRRPSECICCIMFNITYVLQTCFCIKKNRLVHWEAYFHGYAFVLLTSIDPVILYSGMLFLLKLKIAHEEITSRKCAASHLKKKKKFFFF